jgi:hypothetical protein
MMMIIAMLLFVFTVVGLLRSGLIVMGLYKNPILASFEQYGPQEYLPLPLLTLLIWTGGFLIAVGIWVSLYVPVPMPLVTLGIILAAIAGGFHYNYAMVWKWYYRVIRLPRWHHELLERTTRYERRRIAYMWLHLPLRLRLLYNSSDQAFFIWADFVIMGTIREEETEVFDEHFYAGR